MNRRCFLLAISAVHVVNGQHKTKGPDIEVLEAAGKVEENLFVIDGRVKNVSERPIRKLTVFYEILDSDRNVLTRQKGEIEEEELPPGGEAGFHAQLTQHARAISFRLSFEDSGERELRSAKSGPFPIQ